MENIVTLKEGQNDNIRDSLTKFHEYLFNFSCVIINRILNRI